MSTRRASRKCVFSYVLLFSAVLLTVLMVIFHYRVRSHLSELCRFKCSDLVNRILTDAALDAAASEGEYYRVVCDSGGRIISVKAETKALNELQSRLRKAVTESIARSDHDNITLKLGDLTDITFLSGRGPEITVPYQQSGTVDTELRTSFDSAGMNQTRLRVWIAVTVEFTAFLPTGREEMIVTQEYTAVDTVIVGEIPDLMLDDTDQIKKAAE